MPNGLIRSAKLEDLPAIFAISEAAGAGITSLPQDAATLKEHLEKSLEAFSTPLSKPYNESYLFVLEIDGRVVGTSGILSRTGIESPFLAYRLKSEPLKSDYLKIDREVESLEWVEMRKRPTEIGTLFLESSCRKKHLGKLLSFSRFLFMADYPSRFTSTIIGELRGYSEQGISPFWEAIGRPFFGISYPEADQLRILHPEVISELFPKNPIYLDLLPESARSIVGQPHLETAAAYHILKCQGFKRSHFLDLFDGGPHVQALKKDVAAIRESDVKPITSIKQEVVSQNLSIVSNQSLEFRATLASIETTEEGIILSQTTADQLEVEVGQTIRYYTLYGNH